MGQAYYGSLVNPIKSELSDAFFAVGYTSVASDTLGEKSGGRLAVRMAEVVGGAVAAFEADSSGGDSTGVCPQEGCFWSAEARRYYARDHLGSVRAVVDGTGRVKEAKDYYAWGLEMPGRVFTQGEPTEEGFTGHERDAETSMLYAGARYYLPALGRWTAVDPLADQFPSVSPYNYALNNPVSLLDPDGRSPAGGCCPGLPNLAFPLKHAMAFLGDRQSQRELAGFYDEVGRTLVEPYDWARIGVDWSRGEGSRWDAAAMLPFMSGGAGRFVGAIADGSDNIRLVSRTGDVDEAAENLAKRFDGEASVSVEGFGNREFDMISNDFLGQTTNSASAISNPRNFLSSGRRNQIRSTLDASGELGRKALFEFTAGRPHDDVIDFIQRNADRRNVEVEFIFGE